MYFLQSQDPIVSPRNVFHGKDLEKFKGGGRGGGPTHLQNVVVCWRAAHIYEYPSWKGGGILHLLLKKGREIMPYYRYKFPPTLISSPNVLVKMVTRTLNPLHCVWWQNLYHPLIIAEGGM